MIKQIKVVYPVIDFEQSGCPIKYLYDENLKQYKTIKELLNSIKTHTTILLYFYNIAYYWFEKQLLIAENDYDKHCWKSRGAHNSRFSWVQTGITKTSHSDPNVDKTRIKTESGYLIDLMDVSTYLPARDPFSVKPEDIKRDYNIVVELVKTFMLFGGDSIPKTVAGMGREIMRIKPTPDDIVSQEVLRFCKIAYIGGQYYLDREGPVNETLYNYDYRSMYTGLMVQKWYPVLPSAVEHDKFVPVDNETRLAIYHIKHIDVKLRPDGLPTFLNHKNEFTKAKQYLQEGSTSCYGMGNYQSIKTRGDGFPLDVMWITSLDFDLLVQNYNIKRLEIDKTIEFTKTIKGCVDAKAMEYLFAQKEGATGHRREALKILLETMTGSLGQKPNVKSKERLEFLTEKGAVSREERGELILSNFHYACFLTAWGRHLINKMFHKAGGVGAVHSVDTDGIWTFNRILDDECKDGGLCTLRLDATSFSSFWWGMRQYIICQDPMVRWDPKNVEWEPHIQGLRKGYYEYGEERFEFPIIKWDRQLKQYDRVYAKYSLKAEEYNEE